MNTKFALSLIAVLLFFISGCEKKPLLIELSGNTMGTYYMIKYLPPSTTLTADKIKQGVDETLKQVNREMSTFQKDSTLSRFNQSRAINTPFPVSAQLIQVVSEAKRIHDLTDGNLDITVGPLVNLWGFGPPKGEHIVPSDEQIALTKLATGFDKLTLGDTYLMKSNPDVYLDLSAIAKGYGVDQVAEYLAAQHISNYIVDIGGEVRSAGKNGDHQWRVAIEKPDTALSSSPQRIVLLENQSMATSGSYRNYFESGGVEYSHTIDPRTGKPIRNGIVSITVITPSCMSADGFSTGLGVFEAEKSIAVANQLNLPVYIIVKQEDKFIEYYSIAFKPFMQYTE